LWIFIKWHLVDSELAGQFVPSLAEGDMNGIEGNGDQISHNQIEWKTMGFRK
jgi:hypothetical protein